MDASEPVILEVIKEPTAWGIAVLVAILVYFFVRDIRSPEKAASNTILSGFVEYSGSAFEVAGKAMEMASASNLRAESAESQAREAAASAIRCERRHMAALSHIRDLTIQLLDAGIEPKPMPSELTE